jgi:hypothetical protein
MASRGRATSFLVPWIGAVIMIGYWNGSCWELQSYIGTIVASTEHYIIFFFGWCGLCCKTCGIEFVLCRLI